MTDKILTWDKNGRKIIRSRTKAEAEAAAIRDRQRSIPKVVSRFQAKAALAQAGLLDQVEAAISGGDAITKLAWEEAVEYHRESPMIEGLAKSLGLTDDQIDDLFIAAGQISA